MGKHLAEQIIEKEGNASLLDISEHSGEERLRRVPSANSFKHTLLKLTREETNLGARAEAGAADEEMSLHAYSPGFNLQHCKSRWCCRKPPKRSQNGLLVTVPNTTKSNKQK